MTTLEKAARAAQNEILRAMGGVTASAYLGWEDDVERPPIASTYVDGDLDLVAIARAVLMAVREPDEDIWVAIGTASHDAYDTFPMVIDAILAQSEDPS